MIRHCCGISHFSKRLGLKGQHQPIRRLPLGLSFFRRLPPKTDGKIENDRASLVETTEENCERSWSSYKYCTWFLALIWDILGYTNWRSFNVIPTAGSISLRACNSGINYFSVQRGVYWRDDAKTRIKQIMELTFSTCNFLDFQVAKGKHSPAPKFSNIKSASCRVLEFRNSEALRFEKFADLWNRRIFSYSRCDIPILQRVKSFENG